MGAVSTALLVPPVASADPGIALHAVPSTWVGCASVDPDSLSCETLRTGTDNSGTIFVFVIATEIPDLRGIQFGVSYDSNVNVLGWQQCVPASAIASAGWPASDTGLALALSAPASPEGPLDAVVLGFFVVEATSDELSIAPYPGSTASWEGVAGAGVFEGHDLGQVAFGVADGGNSPCFGASDPTWKPSVLLYGPHRVVADQLDGHDAVNSWLAEGDAWQDKGLLDRLGVDVITVRLVAGGDTGSLAFFNGHPQDCSPATWTNYFASNRGAMWDGDDPFGALEGTNTAVYLSPLYLTPFSGSMSIDCPSDTLRSLSPGWAQVPECGMSVEEVLSTTKEALQVIKSNASEDGWDRLRFIGANWESPTFRPVVFPADTTLPSGRFVAGRNHALVGLCGESVRSFAALWEPGLESYFDELADSLDVGNYSFWDEVFYEYPRLVSSTPSGFDTGEEVCFTVTSRGWGGSYCFDNRDNGGTATPLDYRGIAQSFAYTPGTPISRIDVQLKRTPVLADDPDDDDPAGIDQRPLSYFLCAVDSVTGELDLSLRTDPLVIEADEIPHRYEEAATGDTLWSRLRFDPRSVVQTFDGLPSSSTLAVVVLSMTTPVAVDPAHCGSGCPTDPYFAADLEDGDADPDGDAWVLSFSSPYSWNSGMWWRFSLDALAPPELLDRDIRIRVFESEHPNNEVHGDFVKFHHDMYDAVKDTLLRTLKEVDPEKDWRMLPYAHPPYTHEFHLLRNERRDTDWRTMSAFDDVSAPFYMVWDLGDDVDASGCDGASFECEGEPFPGQIGNIYTYNGATHPDRKVYAHETEYPRPDPTLGVVTYGGRYLRDLLQWSFCTGNATIWQHKSNEHSTSAAQAWETVVFPRLQSALAPLRLFESHYRSVQADRALPSFDRVVGSSVISGHARTCMVSRYRSIDESATTAQITNPVWTDERVDIDAVAVFPDSWRASASTTEIQTDSLVIYRNVAFSDSVPSTDYWQVVVCGEDGAADDLVLEAGTGYTLGSQAIVSLHEPSAQPGELRSDADHTYCGGDTVGLSFSPMVADCFEAHDITNLELDRQLILDTDADGDHETVVNLGTITVPDDIDSTLAVLPEEESMFARARVRLCKSDRTACTPWSATDPFRVRQGTDYVPLTGLPSLTGTVRAMTWADYDRDGDDDVYISVRSDGGVGAVNQMWRNDGGTFVDVTAGALADTSDTYATARGDFNADGWTDLYVCNPGKNRLLAGGSAFGFTDVTPTLLEGSVVSSDATFIDVDNDGDLDLHVVNDGSADNLFRNDGAGQWTDIASGPIADAGSAYSASWADYNSDGYLDVFLAKGRAGDLQSHLLKGGASGFTDVTAGDLVEDVVQQTATWGDYDNDGDLDLYANSRLYQNVGDDVFLRVEGQIGLGAAAAVGGSSWFDEALDGDLDLYLGDYQQPNRLFENESGVLSRSGCGPELDDGRVTGVVPVDWDGDGDLDLAVSRHNDGLLFLRADGAAQHWFRVRAQATLSGLAAPGGCGVRLEWHSADGEVQVRDLGLGGGRQGEGPLTETFGLGATSDTGRLIVHWQGGSAEYQPLVDTELQIPPVVTGTDPSQVIPGHVVLLAPMPNPFNPRVRVRMGLPSRAHSTLQVYDAAGRRVRTLVNETLEPGFHDFVWDGTSDSGSDAASGVYFFKLTTPKVDTSRKATLLR